MVNVARAGVGFATLPFDGIDHYASTFIHDDFIGLDETEEDLTNATGVVIDSVESVWNGSEVSGDSTATVEGVVGVADHPGIARLSTGAATPADGDIAALMLGPADGDDATDSPFVLDDNGVYIAAVIDIPDVSAHEV